MREEFRVQSESTVEALESLAPQWEALDATTFPRTPFSSPAWNIIWWKHFRHDSALVRDQLRVCSIWDADGRLRAVAPMMITEQPGFGPLRARRLQFFGADKNVTEIRGLVCRPQDEAAAVAALAADLVARASEWDFTYWQGLRHDEALAAVRSAGQTEEGLTFPDYYLEPREDMKSNLPRNVKESLRKCYNSLKRDGHEFEFRVVEDPADIEAALLVFFDLHSSRAAAEGTIKHNDVFASPLARAFLLDVMQAFAAQRRARIFQLAIGGEVVASRLGFSLDKELYLYFSGFRPEWGQYSVMTTTLWEILQYAIRKGSYDAVNLSPGRDVSKTRWRPLELPITSATLISPSWRGRAVHRAYTGMEQARDHPKLATLFRRIRRRG